MLDRLAGLNPEKVTLVVNPGNQDEIEACANAVMPGRVVCQVQEKPLGIAHAILSGGIEPGPLLVILGDTIMDAPLAEWIPEGDFIGVKEVCDPRRFGVAELDGAGMVTHVVEKPERPMTNLALVGLYYIQDSGALKKAIEKLISSGSRTKDEFQITDALDILLAGGWRPCARAIDEWYDCGKIDALLDSNRRLLANYPPPVPDLPGVELRPPVAMAKGASVAGGRIGPCVTVMEGAVIRDSEISDSIVSSCAVIEGSSLCQSVVGKEARITGFSGSLSVGDHSEVSG